MLPAALDERNHRVLGQLFETFNVLPETIETLVGALASLAKLGRCRWVLARGHGEGKGRLGAALVEHLLNVGAIGQLFWLAERVLGWRQAEASFFISTTVSFNLHEE